MDDDDVLVLFTACYTIEDCRKGYENMSWIIPGIFEDDWIILGYIADLTASELLNVNTAQWQL